jgi:hypothetical protein
VCSNSEAKARSGMLRFRAPSPAAVRHRLLPLARLMFLSVRVAFNWFGPKSHWTGMHRIILKARGYFSVFKGAPPVGLI